MSLRPSLRSITYLLFSIIVGLVLAHSILQFLSVTAFDGQPVELIERFNMDNEASIPTWFSQIVLFIISVLLGVIGWTKGQIRDGFTHHWLFLAGVFLYLSIDEGAALHETLITPIKQLLHNLPDFLYFAWVLPFGAIVIVLGLLYIKFLRHLPRDTQKLTIAAGIIYISGALVMEMVGGYILGSELPHCFYLMATTIEEALEMIGSGLFIITLLGYIHVNNLQINVRVSP